MTNDAILLLINQTVEAIHADASVPGQDTGYPRYGMDSCGRVTAGMAPSGILWTTDRGNWMWDGALVVLRAMGIDTDAPLA